MIFLAENILQELDTLVDRKPDLVGERGSLFISTVLPAACIRLTVSRDVFFRHVMNLPNFSHYSKIIPVSGRRFDVAVLSKVTLTDNKVVLGGMTLDLL